MSNEDHLADQIIETLVELTDVNVDEFVIHFDLFCQTERSANGLVDTLGCSGFSCRTEAAEGGWTCVASLACVADFDVIAHDARRFKVLVDEYDCEFRGFRVVTQCGATNTGSQHSDELAEELMELLKSCPSLARICDFERAIEQFREGQYEVAFHALWKLCDLEPTEQCHYLPIMATCRFHQQNYSEAAHLYEHALALLLETEGDQSIRLETLVNLATCYRELDQVERAREVLETAVRDDFFCASAHFQLARLLSSLGDFDQGLRHLREAILGDVNYIECARTEVDFVRLRDHSEFRSLV